MRYILFFLILFVSVSQAQMQVVESAASYAATDTTDWVGISPVRAVKLAFYALDSCNVQILCDYRGAGSAAAIYQTRYVTGADSTNSAVNAGYYQGYTLRNQSLELDSLPGASMVRFRVVKLTTKNGTTSPTYKLLLYQ